MKRLAFTYMVLFTLVLLPLAGQDLYFSQFYASKWNMGASFAGTTDESRLTLNMRD